MYSTRADIESEFSIKDGKIVSPGKFEGEPIYVPYFYESMMNGYGIDDVDDDYNDSARRVIVCSYEIEQFPELKNAGSVVIWVDDFGFVNSETVSA